MPTTYRENSPRTSFLTIPAVTLSGLDKVKLMAAAGGVLTIVDTYVWHPAISYFTLMALVLADMLLDNLVKKQPLGWKAVGVRLAVYTALLSCSHILGTRETVLSWLPHVAMGALATFHFFTLVRNLGRAHVMPEELTDLITLKLKRKLHEQLDASGTPDPERPDSDARARPATEPVGAEQLHEHP